MAATILTGVFLLVVILLLTVQISEIEVSGNKRYTKEQIIDMLFDGKWSKNAVYCYYENRFREHRVLPFIEEYKIEFKSPTKVEVVVFEKSVVGYVSYMSSYMYFDKDGIVVESSNEQLPGVPWITGLEFGHIMLYEPLPVGRQEAKSETETTTAAADEDGEEAKEPARGQELLDSRQIFEQILNLTQVLSVNEVQVDKIHYGSYGEVQLFIEDIVVELGSGGNLNGKIAELRDILPELSGYAGTLYLDTYDEANSNPTYTFKKK
ncbi:MAG: FtsQ-type POTRA domain-containing protein [Lachnospiraceae bacterium]|nr:FtsQ-type POTRA domain-containing protein [Lachnospiraceae bacterium]